MIPPFDPHSRDHPRRQTLDEAQDTINGVCVNIRKREDRVALWCRTTDEAQVMEVGRRLRALLKVDKSVPMKFQAFADEGKALYHA